MDVCKIYECTDFFLFFKTPFPTPWIDWCPLGALLTINLSSSLVYVIVMPEVIEK